MKMSGCVCVLCVKMCDVGDPEFTSTSNARAHTNTDVHTGTQCKKMHVMRNGKKTHLTHIPHIKHPHQGHANRCSEKERLQPTHTVRHESETHTHTHTSLARQSEQKSILHPVIFRGRLFFRCVVSMKHCCLGTRFVYSSLI